MEINTLLLNMQKDGVLKTGSEEDAAMREVSAETRKLCAEMNNGAYTDEEIKNYMSGITGHEIDESFSLFVPFTADFGKNVFINSGCRFQDQGGITIGDGSLIGHNVVLATINHDYDPKNRGTMFLKPIVLETNSWIGSNTTILPGITIGENSVVAAGSVVTKDVSANTIVAGNPAKFMSSLEDKI